MITKHEVIRSVIALTDVDALTRRQLDHFFCTVRGWAYAMPEIADLMASYTMQHIIHKDGDGPRTDLAWDSIPKRVQVPEDREWKEPA